MPLISDVFVNNLIYFSYISLLLHFNLKLALSESSVKNSRNITVLLAFIAKGAVARVILMNDT